ncbi:hypothetical protein EX30DRAFT_361442 [Ascodesmis nigricans]|uniref:Uncharacterized protein n=1 Tax=Ascodesmis nigricans TaxID=341454 RepID=A0A4S2N8V2_9PEZI|nr:hypothetical protein EX30DRAFT_361442 [Ascodesmis nigricans]
MAPPAARALVRRSFTTTARTLNGQGPQSPSLGSTWTTRHIPPESPEFIEVPRSKAPNPAPRPYIKGVLPKPKSLFPKRSAPYKGSPEFIAAATPKRTAPLPEPAAKAEVRAYQDWQRRMAEVRKSHLREGFSILKQRKEAKETALKENLKARADKRNEKLNQAIAEDVRLTLPTVLSTLRMDSGPLQDPNRAERLKAAREKFASHQQSKRDQRRHQVLKLYEQAQNFIVTEMQLDNAIDEAFKEQDLTATIQGALRGMRGMGVVERLAQRRRGGMGTSKNVELLQVQRALAGQNLADVFSGLGDKDVAWGEQ